MATLVIGFDGSSSARIALERAAALFAGADAVVVSVAEGLAGLDDGAASARVALPDEVIRTAVGRLRESALDQAREQAAEGARLAKDAGLQARPEHVPAEASVWATILGAARHAAADVVVGGTRGRGAAVRAVLGSAATGLVRHAHVPVLVVPEEAPPAASGPLLVAFDGSAAAIGCVEATAPLLAGRAAVVLHAWRSDIRHTLTGRALAHAPLADLREIVATLDEVSAERAQDVAERGAALARELGLDARSRTEESTRPTAQAILDVTGEEDAAAITVGRRGRGVVATAVLGSVSTSVVHASDRPVLVAAGREPQGS